MAKLTDDEIIVLLEEHPGWHLKEGALVRDFTFKDFKQAIAFVNHVAELAEQQSHHPAISINYNGVRLELITHDEAAVTERDLKMVGLLGDGVEV